MKVEMVAEFGIWIVGVLFAYQLERALFRK